MIRERLAKEAHLVWQRWMGYMLANLDEQHIDRWRRQANTIYENLPESEKESDRAIADRYLAAIIEVAEVEMPLLKSTNHTGDCRCFDCLLMGELKAQRQLDIDFFRKQAKGE